MAENIVSEVLPKAVVIDNGSYTCKAGFAGDDSPSVVVPTMVGTPRNKIPVPGMNVKDKYVCDEAVSKRGVLILECPMEKGLVTNWDFMEAVWHHTLHNELRVDPEKHPILLTQAPLSPKASTERIAQIMFETFQTPAMQVCIPAVLSLYATGRTTGLVVDSGQEVTSVVPVPNGHALEDAVSTMDLAGLNLTNYMVKLLNESGFSFTTKADIDLAKDMKEKLCYVATGPTKVMAESSNQGMSYVLPDGSVINLDWQRHQCPEALFQPGLLSQEIPGVHHLTFASVMKCDEAIRKEMLANIVLAGGSMEFKDMDRRMEIELSCLVPPETPVKTIIPLKGKFSAWVGGSILAFLPNFQQMWISKHDYEETGPSIVHSKSL